MPLAANAIEYHKCFSCSRFACWCLTRVAILCLRPIAVTCKVGCPPPSIGCDDENKFLLRPTDARVGYWYDELVVLGVWVDVRLKAILLV